MEWFVTFCSTVLCRLGWHGPKTLGNESQWRSLRTESFERVCGHCGAKWHGETVYGHSHRWLGNWKRVK